MTPVTLNPVNMRKGRKAWALMMKDPAGNCACAARSVGLDPKNFSHWISITGRSGQLQAIRAKKGLSLISKVKSPRP